MKTQTLNGSRIENGRKGRSQIDCCHIIRWVLYYRLALLDLVDEMRQMMK